ncbi:MAG TPA: radical SAM protein [Nitrospiraceae bacterium]|nr:radical SAM protein [Nitrospiraceae bacterium]
MKTISSDHFLQNLSAKAAESRRPEGVTFELTYGCNLRCVHCYNPTHRALSHELTTLEICALLDQIADLGVLTITFTGGEPSIRPDIGDILRHAHRQGLMTHLMTNATRITASFADLLHETAVSQINVSIYGATEEVYEQMTAVPGSYRQFRQGLLNLAAASLPVVVRMPVTTINHHEIQACRQLVESLRMKFQYCLEIMSSVTGDQTPLQYRLAPDVKVRIDQEMLPHRWIDIQEEYPCTRQSFIECACGQSRFAITPYGEMNLCTAFPIPRYDLRIGTVKEGWEILKQTVDQAHPNDRYECPTCQLRPHCRLGRSDAWLETGDMSSCLPHFKEWAQLEYNTHALLDPRRPR